MKDTIIGYDIVLIHRQVLIIHILGQSSQLSSVRKEFCSRIQSALRYTFGMTRAPNIESAAAVEATLLCLHLGSARSFQVRRTTSYQVQPLQPNQSEIRPLLSAQE